MNRLLALSFWLLLLPFPAQAHFLWLEHECGGDKATCPAKLFFGEYPREVETVETRLTERSASVLFSHRGSESKPEAFTPQGNHYEASIRGNGGKPFYISAIDDKSAVVDYSKIRIGIVRPIFYTSVLVPGIGEIPPAPAHTLQLVPASAANLRIGQPAAISIRFKGKPLTERAAVHINAPNGWAWEGEVKDGSVSFTPLWEGQYVADVIVLEDVPGEFQGKTYEAIRHRATLTLRAEK